MNVAFGHEKNTLTLKDHLAKHIEVAGLNANKIHPGKQIDLPGIFLEWQVISGRTKFSSVTGSAMDNS
jgi:hypothetical protein